MERKCIALSKHMDEVMPEGIREFISGHSTEVIKEFWCAYCGKPSKAGLYPMRSSSTGNSVYTFWPICYCHNLDGQVLFFRIIKPRDGRPERYQLGFCSESVCNRIRAEYLEKDSDESAVDDFLPVRDFWESCYLLPSGNLLIQATDGNPFMTILNFTGKARSSTMKYYDEKYEVTVRQNGFQSPIVVTGDDAGAEFGFKVQELSDENVAMSRQDEVVVRCRDKWLAYNKTRSRLYTVEESEITKCSFYVVPTFDVEVGDLVCDGNSYFFVSNVGWEGIFGTKIDETTKSTTSDLKMKPECRILGMGIYYKVLAAPDVMVNASGVPCGKTMLSDAAMAKIFMLSSMMENSGKPGLKNLLVPLSFTTNKNIDVAARTVMLYAMLNGMYGSE